MEKLESVYSAAMYKDMFDKFSTSLNMAIVLSVKYSRIPAPEGKHWYASALFTKLCVTGKSIQKLLPNSNRKLEIQHWDFTSVASMSRVFIENYLMYFYLCADDVSKDEWDFRWRLLNLHDHVSRIKFTCDLEGNEEKKEDMLKSNEILLICKDELNANAIFAALPEKKKNHFLRGVEAFNISQDELVEKIGISIPTFRAVYRFLSSQVHTFPMSFYRKDEHERGRGVYCKQEMYYHIMALEWLLPIFNFAITDYIKLFDGLEHLKAK
ncbi:DUF5677 domain-containing protein [Aeromonas allosaccharophila]|uniref:DUF5677 domain-containing protein n=1 Tax=Aeromonas allosaccharophila TaxID=656 RepID=UPI0013D7D047|nr:DUF5677 domain-containing protein [Aeromonas allosaccharophila]WDO02899.1 DUF5677 domain-containing protein [Aeromonas allosaccharophila]